MKRNLFIFCCLFCSLAIQAQSGWLVKSIDVSLGVDEDRVSGLSNDYFTDMLRDENLTYTGPDFDDRTAYSMICENPYVRLMATLAPLGSKSTELRVGINGIFNRLDGVTYYSEEEGYASFSTIGDEIAFESTFIKTTGIWGLRFYGGVGANTGFAFNNRYYGWGSQSIIVDDVSLRGANQPISDVMRVSNPYYDQVELRNGMSQRVFLQGGVGFRFFKRVEVGMEGRYGYGYRWIAGAGKKAIRLQSVALNARYYLRKQ